MQLRSREWLYIGLLQAAVNEEKDLGYSASKGKPHGPGIDYLIAEAAKHGHTISPERAHALIAAFNRLPKVNAKIGIQSDLKAHALILRNGQLLDD